MSPADGRPAALPDPDGPGAGLPGVLVAWPRAEGARRARELFRERFGTEPDGVWSAPGRVNVVGEHTDYNAGLCLPVALPHRTYVALRRTDGDEVRVASRQEGDGLWTAPVAAVGPGTVHGWGTYVAGVAWALSGTVRGVDAAVPVRGFDAAVDSCVPYGAGLSSSAALECATAVALDERLGLGLAAADAGRERLVEACIRAENEVAGAATGGMDQAAALLSRPGHALLLDTRDGSRRQVPLDLAAHGLALLVVDTRAEHRLNDGQYALRRWTCEAAAERLGATSLREVDLGGLGAALERIDGPLTLPDGRTVDAATARRRVRHVVTENARVGAVVDLLDAGRPQDTGPLLDASHASLRDDYEVSCVELDLAVSAARAAGALGARMTGGGFGGSAVALVPLDAVATVGTAVRDAFAAAGLTEPGLLLAEAAGPADREEDR